MSGTPKIHTLHNLKRVNPLVEPVVSQTVIFMVFEETKVVKVTYLMGDPHTMINVPLYHFNLAMELQQGEAYDLPILDARAIWNYLVDKLGWVNVA